MRGYRHTVEVAADDYERGIEDALTVLQERAERCGGVVDARLAEVEIRSILLRQIPVPQHDRFR